SHAFTHGFHVLDEEVRIARAMGRLHAHQADRRGNELPDVDLDDPDALDRGLKHHEEAIVREAFGVAHAEVFRALREEGLSDELTESFGRLFGIDLTLNRAIDADGRRKEGILAVALRDQKEIGLFGTID